MVQPGAHSPAVARVDADRPQPPAAPAAASPAQGRTLGWVGSTYFAEGLPFSIVHKVASEFLVNAKVSAEVVGLANLAHLPWNLKFLWAPLVDRYGSAKKWLVGAQLGLGLATLFLAAFAATFVPWAFGVGILLVACIAATNDIAVDAYYLRRLDKQQQGAFSGVRVGGYRIALMFGAGGIVTLGGLAGFPVAFAAAGLVLAGLGVVHGASLAPDQADHKDRSVGTIVKSAASSFFSQKGVVVAVVVLMTYRAGDALMFAMNAKFLDLLGLNTATRGVINGTFGTVASIAGSLAGAAIIARAKFERAFLPITIAQSLAILLYVALAVTRPSLPFVAAVVLVEQFVAGVGTAAFSVFIMRLCQGEQKATQFAFASSVMSLAMTGAGAGSGFLFTAVGPTVFFAIAFAASVPGVVATMLWPKAAR